MTVLKNLRLNPSPEYLVYVAPEDEPSLLQQLTYTHQLSNIANCAWSVLAAFLLVGFAVGISLTPMSLPFKLMLFMIFGFVGGAFLLHPFIEGAFVLGATDRGLVFRGRGFKKQYCLIPWGKIKKIEYNFISIVERGNTGTKTDLFFKTGDGTIEISTLIPRNVDIRLKPCNGGRVAIDGYWTLYFASGIGGSARPIISSLKSVSKKRG